MKNCGTSFAVRMTRTWPKTILGALIFFAATEEVFSAFDVANIPSTSGTLTTDAALRRGGGRTTVTINENSTANSGPVAGNSAAAIPLTKLPETVKQTLESKDPHANEKLKEDLVVLRKQLVELEQNVDKDNAKDNAKAPAVTRTKLAQMEKQLADLQKTTEREVQKLTTTERETFQKQVTLLVQQIEILHGRGPKVETVIEHYTGTAEVPAQHVIETFQTSDKKTEVVVENHQKDSAPAKTDILETVMETLKLPKNSSTEQFNEHSIKETSQDIQVLVQEALKDLDDDAKKRLQQKVDLLQQRLDDIGKNPDDNESDALAIAQAQIANLKKKMAEKHAAEEQKIAELTKVEREKFEKQITSLTQQVQTLQSRDNKPFFEEQLKALQDQLGASHDVKVKDLTEQIQTLSTSLNKLSQANNDLQSMVTQLRGEPGRDDYAAQIKDLQEKIDQVTAQLAAARQAEKERENYMQQDQQKDLEREKSLMAAKEQLTALKESLVTERTQDKEEDADFKQQINDLQDELENLRDGNDKLDKERDEVQAKLEKNVGDHEELNKENQELKQDVAQLTAQLAQKKAELDKNKTLLSQTDIDKRFKDEAMQRLQADLANTKAEKAEAFAKERDLEVQIASLTQKTADLRSEVQIAKLSMNVGNQANFGNYQELLRAKEGEISNVRAELVRVQEQLRAAQDASRNPDSAGKISELTEANKGLTEKIAALEADLKNAQAQLAEKRPMAETNAAAAEKIKALETEIATTKANLGNVQKQLSAAAEKVSALNAQTVALQQTQKNGSKSKQKISQVVVVAPAAKHEDQAVELAGQADGVQQHANIKSDDKQDEDNEDDSSSTTSSDDESDNGGE